MERVRQIMMKNRKITSKLLDNLTHRCSQCGNQMISTGSMIAKMNVDTWYIDFECSYCNEYAPIWKPSFDRIINRVLKSTNQKDIRLIPDRLL